MNDKHTRQVERKIIAIGWDGATWDLLKPWVEADKLPHLAEMMASGAHGPLRSTPLPLSPAAWSTILTGQNPGRHGVFDWFERKPGSYQVEYVHTGRLGARPVWEVFNRGGQRMGVFNPPMLYPAVPLDGFMLSGMAAPNPGAPDFAYPPGLIDEIESQFGPYRLGEAEIYQYGSEQAYLDSLLEWLELQQKVARYLIENHPCEAFMLVFMQPDHAQHKLWRYLDPEYPGTDPEHDRTYQDAIYRVYREMDRFLGELRADYGERSHILLLSDHGAGPNYGVMYINRWLEQQGYLRLKGGPVRQVKYWLAKGDWILRAYRWLAALGLGRVARLVSKSRRNQLVNSLVSFDDIDWTRTRAYARGAFGQIFLNLKGREPQGTVEPGEQAEGLIAELMAKLSVLKHPESGEPLITDLRRKEAAIHGPYVERAAEILFSIQDYAYQSAIKLGLDSPEILGPSEYGDSGGHRPEGILVVSGPGIRAGEVIEGAGVTDIAPTLLALADLPVPRDMDGRVLEAIFKEEWLERVRYSETDEEGAGSTTGGMDLSDQERAELEERLRSLGYLG